MPWLGIPRNLTLSSVLPGQENKYRPISNGTVNPSRHFPSDAPTHLWSLQGHDHHQTHWSELYPQGTG